MQPTTPARRRLAVLSLAAGALCVLGSGVAQAQTPAYRAEYRLSTTLGTAFPWGQAGERWIELVKEKTQGRIHIKLYSGNSLVLMPDYKAMDALTQGEVGKDLFAVLEKRDVIPLAWGENGFRELSNSKRPVATPADLKGMKFRVVGSPLYNETFTALGANPTQMSWADAQPALASGAVDGQENPLSVFVGAKLSTVGQKHLTLWHYVADPLIFVVNKNVWNSWTPADREAVRQAALQAGRENVEKARKGIAGTDNAVLKQIEAAAGVTVTRLTPEQRTAFVQATRPVYDKWARQIGADLVKKAEAAIARR